MELSLLCEVKVLLCVVDKHEKAMIFSSENNVSNFLQGFLTNINETKDLYTHEDVKSYNFSMMEYLMKI
jgi:hypothetical protein